MKLHEAYNHIIVTEERFTFYYYSSYARLEPYNHIKTLTLRLEAKLMIDRWRSLFLCAGVNSGREAALSTAARMEKGERQ